MDIELLADLLYGPARLLQGSNLSDEQLLKISNEAFENQSFCIVRNWMLIDVMLSDEHERAISKDGLTSTLLYAPTVISEVDAAGVISDGVLSTFQLGFDGFLFETQDAIYVLAGRGCRKHAGVPAVCALARECGSNFWNGYEQRSIAVPA
ncbi:DUF6957 family protein [Pseudomonas sp. NA-150]|uniref:DUF6957 family protein n=1 Tax=Pseudomonas sp. NA-150 TaxID=3367525 RepID=UPI0037C941AB